MSQNMPGGYAGKILRVDLTSGRTWSDPWSPEEMRLYVGGAGLGAKILWEEVPAAAGWDQPDNRLILATGPLAGLPLWGTGGLSVVTRGALTNGATSTQANGFFGACLKYSGYDAIVIQGESSRWAYLYINDDVAELRDAAHLLGKDTWETQDALQAEHGLSGHQMSVYSIGPAGEKLVRFAAIQGDYGHVASKNGCGAVMGKKRLKAVVIVRGTQALRAADPRGLFQAADEIAHDLKTNPTTRSLYEYGTLPGVLNLHSFGGLPIKNYTTNVPPPGTDMSVWEAPSLREGFDHRGHQCNACGMHHCHMQVIPAGLHKGELVDEPEYEGWSGAGWAIGCTDPVAISWLNTQVDRACVDVNEFGWLVGWVMECQEKGYLTPDQLGGLKLPWGDAEAAARLLAMINRREGFGDILAEGVKRAAETLGGPAAECAIYTLKGASPRGHDHRARWDELLDTCTGSTGTLETGPPVHPTELGLPARINPFSPDAVARMVGRFMGRRHFEDSLGACIFTTRTLLENMCRALNAATGWEVSKEEAMQIGRRTAAFFRAFNVRCGIGPEMERPSHRYASVPTDGPAKGQSILPHWEHMLDVWYDCVGYDRKTGRPRAETLRELGLERLIPHVWEA
ncbi:MAG TPA: aldehyde ferredoxin oxidoreductase C-terminal domain-containing protein [Candidatus Methylomirabilis sp.]|nr:aldehyde ferredoxin oxidoreductase C-terminal domain-containing protein [Candidatus Methylomirabilis sp.]